MDLKLPEKRVFIGPALLWKRLLAFIIDLIVLDLLVVSYFRTITMNTVSEGTGFLSLLKQLEANQGQLQALSMMFLLVTVLMLAYFTLLQYATGQTVGCMLLNIHVVHQKEEKQFERPGFWQSILRNIFLIPALPFVLLWLAEPVYYFAAGKGQRLTEWMTGTRVVEQYTL